MSKSVTYYSKDFEWEHLRHEIETNRSFLCHSLPFISDENDNNVASPLQDSDSWNRFHFRHSTGKFFKERRYLLKEFPELDSLGGSSKVLEVGCGDGSTLLPILRAREETVIYACDFSNEAINRLQENIASANLTSVMGRFHPFICDVSGYGFPKWLACSSYQEICIEKEELHELCSEERPCCIGGFDIITLIFTLSTIPIHRMPVALKHCLSVLKPNGVLLFRDYGLYDMTMLRFSPKQRVGYREYMRSDGTRSYFFSLEFTRHLFTSAGFKVLELEYCCVRSTNRRNGKIMRRVWIHGKFEKIGSI